MYIAHWKEKRKVCVIPELEQEVGSSRKQVVVVVVMDGLHLRPWIGTTEGSSLQL